MCFAVVSHFHRLFSSNKVTEQHQQSYRKVTTAGGMGLYNDKTLAAKGWAES